MIRRPWPKVEARNGRRHLYWPSIVDVWHVEPGDKDSNPPCHSKWWQLHFWHWDVKVAIVQRLKRFLFERCTECGRRYPWGYAPVSREWDEPGGRWFRVRPHAYHWECCHLVQLRHQQKQDEQIIRHLHEGTTPLMEWALSYRLNKILESGHAE
ncbi:hypothetical protein [Glycomyces sp. NPDC021274]|uniref:hypothetical protein n=1 Tax=Glycomyces sp. NPDC021274 TaxID=3155120 RepID=UPI0033FCD8F3